MRYRAIAQLLRTVDHAVSDGRTLAAHTRCSARVDHECTGGRGARAHRCRRWQAHSRPTLRTPSDPRPSSTAGCTARQVRKLKPGTFEEFRVAFTSFDDADNPPPGWVRFNMLRNAENSDEGICFGFFDGSVDELRANAGETTTRGSSKR